LGEGGIVCTGLGIELCVKPWCYVDENECENKAVCEAAGGTLGSLKHVNCRQRKREATNTFKNTRYANLMYSHATCGNLDLFARSAAWPKRPGAPSRSRCPTTKWRPTLTLARRRSTTAPLTQDFYTEKATRVLLEMLDEFVFIPSSLNPPLPKMILKISTEFGPKKLRNREPFSPRAATPPAPMTSWWARLAYA
jgi:hypothetical protein